MLNEREQIFEQLKKSQNILVTFGKYWEGDAVASGLALYLFLKKIGKNVEIAAAENPNNKQLSFLPGHSAIKHKIDNLRKFIISLDIRNTKVGQITYKVEKETLDFIVSPQNGFFTKEDITTKSSGFKYDLIIVVSTRDLESLGSVYDNDTEFFYQTPLIDIDHQAGNESFGQINAIDINTVATSEILFDLFSAYDRTAIDEDIATCLLAGLIVSTKSFKTNNISPLALSVASQLISMGARREDIINHLYRSRSLNLLKLWGVVLARLASTDVSKLIWSHVNEEDFEKTKTNFNDLVEVIDELIINIPQAKIVAIFYEAHEGVKKVSRAIIYGVKNINVLHLLKEFNPQGSATLATVQSFLTIKEFESELINSLSEKIKKLAL
jgi:nanoRNase/pAp phosphatase (c-di-AMP/oligoRNAs hydrolase)